jgi:hypothetical protein
MTWTTKNAVPVHPNVIAHAAQSATVTDLSIPSSIVLPTVGHPRICRTALLRRESGEGAPRNPLDSELRTCCRMQSCHSAPEHAPV